MPYRHPRILVAALLAASLAGASRAEPPPPVPPTEPVGMEVLFNGRDLSGWDGDPQLWSARDGVIHGETTTENPAAGNTFLIWKGGDVRDFELRLSCRCSATNNSGIQYRSRHVTDASAANRWVVRGYQHEIRNENEPPNVPGFLYDEGGERGRICLAGERATWGAEEGKTVVESLMNDADISKLVRLDDWNDVVIRAEGNRMRHWLNGRLILDFTDAAPTLARTAGVIALQLHAGAPMWVEFRDIRLQRLP